MFRQVTIVGLGLIGGSLGLAIKRRRLARCVVGYSRRTATVRRAKARGAIDCGTRDLAEAVRGSDVVVIATPVGLIVPIAQVVARVAAPGTIITDVGSVKGAIVRQLDGARANFVGAHPLAGSERNGIAAAEPRLFNGSTCILTPTRCTNAAALRRVRLLWQSLGTCVVMMPPARHDALVAAMSHLPHALAFGLMHGTPAAARRLASRSFLDATRVAASDPRLWEEILLMNRRGVLAALRLLEVQLRGFQRLLARHDARGLHRWIHTARRRRLTYHAGG